MTNTQSSGFHVVEINGNGAQTIIYWIVGLFILCVIAGEIRVWYRHRHNLATYLRKRREKEQRHLEHLEMEAEDDQRMQELIHISAPVGSVLRGVGATQGISCSTLCDSDTKR